MGENIKFTPEEEIKFTPEEQFENIVFEKEKEMQRQKKEKEDKVMDKARTIIKEQIESEAKYNYMDNLIEVSRIKNNPKKNENNLKSFNKTKINNN